MRTSLISTMTLNSSPRTNLAQMQTRLAEASKEVATGRHADVGLTLGDRTGRTVSLRREMGSLDAMMASNGLAKARLEQTQSALEGLNGIGEKFQQSVIALPSTAIAVDVLKRQAQEGLETFMSTMNASDGRSYLFAGINTATKPMPAYDGAPKAAVDAALVAKFGLSAAGPQDDASGLAAITPADMADFLDNEFSALFDSANWSSTWSTASDQPQKSRISSAETVDTSISANTDAFRNLAKALTMIADIGIDHLSEETRAVVVAKSRATVNDALSEMVSDRAFLGVSEQRLGDASARMQTAKDVVEQRISVFEAVDPVEAKVEIDQLSTQIEMSYSLTTKILRLSIMNYA